MIIDAQDYLDNWHLSIVCKIQPGSEHEAVKVNFLPYPKGNRDEWITLAEVTNRIAGPYSMIDQVYDREKIVKNFAGLQEYAKKFVKPGSKDDKPEKKSMPSKAAALKAQAQKDENRRKL